MRLQAGSASIRHHKAGRQEPQSARTRPSGGSTSVPLAAQQRSAEPVGRLARLRSGYLKRSPGLIATISALIGLLTIVEAVLPAERMRVHTITRIIPVPASAAATAVTAVAGLLLLRVAAGLRKRKRRAWRVAVGLTAIM